MSVRDAAMAAVVGALVAVLTLMIIGTASLDLPMGDGILVALPVMAPVGLGILSLFGGPRAVPYQFGKFALVGVLNVAVDLGVLNALLAATGFVGGAGYAGCKAVAFASAVVNSYVWNARWTFRARGGRFATFLAVSVAGLLLNVAVAYAIVEGLGAPGGITPTQWANVGGLIASVSAMVWNFVGYRVLVFDLAPEEAGAGVLSDGIPE